MKTIPERVAIVANLVHTAEQALRGLAVTGDYKVTHLAHAGALLAGAEVIAAGVERELAERQAKTAPQSGDWAKALNTEHLHRARGIVNAMTMEDIIAFEDAEKAAQAGGLVDTKA